MKFVSIVFAGREFDVGQQDDGELRVIYGDAVGMDAATLARRSSMFELTLR
jgi:hypothetical protein